ncbi:YchJ family protein [Aliiglaciecola sp. 3_MG-2023]|uniref:YchJ family protein n=1 Tax=Aliiglaciecola sp. 3_MG-2023 TaxID=3062644 RepID=UPI0026E3EA32|nr:YchJ family protein [Aliiglaciecola sp. 3_MG-2023]MDO6692494.1 YchJ family protein [Aliiglaciecola sp. 3_MG-2023]
MQHNSRYCPCNSNKLFADCCEPFLSRSDFPQTAEQLMRSRFSAYVKKNYQYILDTYATKSRQNLSVNELQQADKGTQWLSLEVVSCANQNSVEFKAYSQVDNTFYLLHEVSHFQIESEKWVYVDGKIIKDTGPFTLSRNDQCLCGSGKKYKKCCLS